MRGYLIPVMGMCLAVDGLLLAGTDRLIGRSAERARILLSAGLGAVYGGACLLPGFDFLGGVLWRLVSLAVMGLGAYGISPGGLRRTALFGVLNMAAGGLALALGGEQTWLLAAVIVCALCLLGLRGNPGIGASVPVILCWKDRRTRITALRDTGNTLRDPVTGEQVLVLSGQVAEDLFGLSYKQLAAPVETMLHCGLPGLRLIPYRSVGGQGMLLGMAMEDVQIGSRRGRAVVAFAPSGLDSNGKFQALAGGTV